MTQEEKDAAWRSLPENIRMKIRKEYNELKSCKHIPTERRNGAMSACENICGYHNLTASEEEKPKMMSKERLRQKLELQEYAAKNRKRLEAQEVALGDVVKVLLGQFAGEKGIVKGIMVTGNDFNDPYYEVDMECEVPDKYKCRKTLISPNNVIGGLNKSDFEVIGNRASSEEEKPRFKVGDIVKVSQDMDWGNGESDKNKEILLNAPSFILEIQGENALLEGAGESVYGLIPLKYLIPYTEKQEPKNGKAVDSSSSLQNGISSLSKEDAKELAKYLAAVDDFIKEYKDSQVDWLAYRKELAKEISVAYAEKGRFEPKDIAVNTMLIVDGIVKRLKGGN